MAIELSANAAQGRMIAAGRLLAGWDQGDLAAASGLSGGTISNVESGRDVREETLKAIRKALREKGIVLTLDKRNGLASAALIFEEPDVDEE